MTDLQFPDLKALDGRKVRVTTTTGLQGITTTLQGSLDVRADAETCSRPRVELVVDCADVFDGTAARRSIPLDDHALARLLASERDGVFEFPIAPSLD